MTSAPTRTTVPERPTLDGLEDKWGAVWEREGTYRFDRARRWRCRARSCSPSTRRRRPCRARCTSATSTPTRTSTSSPASSGCAARRSSTRSAGTTTACPPRGGCRTTTASAATRRSPTTRDFTPAPRRRHPIKPPSSPIEPTELRRAVRASWPRSTRRPSRRSCAGSVSRWTGRISTRPSATHSRATASARSCATSPAARPTAEAPGLWDVTFQTAVAQAELEARDYPGHYHRVPFHRPDHSTGPHRDHPPRADPGVVALIAHPDDERYRRCSARR